MGVWWVARRIGGETCFATGVEGEPFEREGFSFKPPLRLGTRFVYSLRKIYHHGQFSLVYIFFFLDVFIP